MTKEQEICRLREFTKNFTADSYLGPWLAAVIPTVESNIQSDIIPYITVTDEIAEAKRLRDENREARSRLASTMAESQTYAAQCHQLRVEINLLKTQLEELGHHCLDYAQKVKP
jgi:CHAD domain-containing protein